MMLLGEEIRLFFQYGIDFLTIDYCRVKFFGRE
jgi:hypothetical protein